MNLRIVLINSFSVIYGFYAGYLLHVDLFNLILILDEKLIEFAVDFVHENVLPLKSETGYAIAMLYILQLPEIAVISLITSFLMLKLQKPRLIIYSLLAWPIFVGLIGQIASNAVADYMLANNRISTEVWEFLVANPIVQRTLVKEFFTYTTASLFIFIFYGILKTMFLVKTEQI